MDRSVLDAYGWTNIPTDCEFILDYEMMKRMKTRGRAGSARSLGVTAGLTRSATKCWRSS